MQGEEEPPAKKAREHEPQGASEEIAAPAAAAVPSASALVDATATAAPAADTGTSKEEEPDVGNVNPVPCPLYPESYSLNP